MHNCFEVFDLTLKKIKFQSGWVFGFFIFIIRSHLSYKYFIRQVIFKESMRVISFKIFKYVKLLKQKKINKSVTQT